MVTRPISKKVINRLRRITKSRNLTPHYEWNADELNSPGLNFFKRLKNADHRSVQFSDHHNESRPAGYRVRQLRTKDGKIIIKRPDRLPPKETIKELHTFIDIVNSKSPKKFILNKPKANPVGPFIAMKPTHFPNLMEMLGNAKMPPFRNPIFYKPLPSTKRGKLFLKKLSKREGKTEKEIATLIEEAHSEYTQLGKEIIKNNRPSVWTTEIFEKRNILCVGFKDHKPVFMHLVDL